jgi:acetyl esterase/lipase
MTETISRLMEANLLGVFNERDASRRAAMINTIYSPDVRWTDDEGSTVGREALDALTFSGASIEQHKHLDPLVTREMLESNVVDYLAGADPRDPRFSAIFADMQGFPPMLIQVGENEILYDDATRIRDAATAAGVDVSFESWRHGMHVWPVFISGGLPESAAAVERLAAFFKT